MVAKVAAKTPLYTSALVYCAVQVAFLSFLFSFYNIEMGPIIRPAMEWVTERFQNMPIVKNILNISELFIDNEMSEEKTKVLPKERKVAPAGKKAHNSPESYPLGAHLSHLPVFTSEQLSLFDGSRPSKDIYLALLGRVYNVQKGHKHYAPGGGYHFFAGRDATRAFVTGDFTEAGLVDDVSGLGHQDLLGILDWVKFYEKDYELVGVLQGRYYDTDGKPTQRLREVVGLIEDAQHWKAAQTKQSEVFPPCNSEWHKDSGGRVWCSTKSGGIHREWSGVPRRLFNPGTKTFRCACVKNFGAPLSAFAESDEKGNRGDLDNPNLHEYPNCAPTSNSCKIQED